MRDGLGPPPAARNPDTVFLLALLLVSGMGQLVSGAESGSVEALVPGWMLYGWAITLTAGAGITLAGVFWRTRVTALMVEASGRLMLAPTSLAYALAVTVADFGSGALIAGLLLGLTISSAVRLWQIHRDINRMRATMAALLERGDHGA